MTRQFFRNLNHFYRTLGTWDLVAEYIGVNPRTLRRYWEGTRNPSRERKLRFV
jgi:transcriptional regulator with XRE-family HTH domain